MGEVRRAGVDGEDTDARRDDVAHGHLPIEPGASGPSCYDVEEW